MHHPPLDTLLSNCTCLRALDLQRSCIQNLPSTIGKLFHLRYLNLSWSENLEELPQSITKLHNLQTLNLKHCGSLKELPKDLSKLVKLRILDVEGCNRLTSMPWGMGKLSCLRKLTMFVVAKANSSRKQSVIDQLEDLKTLSSLKGNLKIWIRIPEYVAYMKGDDREGGYLRNKQHLIYIEIAWESGERTDYQEALLEDLQPHSNLRFLSLVGYGGVRMPSWARKGNLATFLPNLVKIQLIDCYELQYLELPRKLRHLKSLVLDGLRNLEYVEITGTSSYASELRADEQYLQPSFPCLSHLSIRRCPNLMSIPLCHVLESLTLDESSEMLRRRIIMSKDHRQGGESGATSSSLYHDEMMKSIAHDQKSRQMEITATSSDAIPSMHEYERQQGLAAMSGPVTEAKSKMTHIPEIEGDLETFSSDADLIQMSPGLETEPYTSIEENIFTTVVNPERSLSTSETNVLVGKRAVEVVTEQMRIAHDREAELYRSFDLETSGPSLATSVNLEMITTTSRPTHIFDLEGNITRSIEPEISVSVSLSGPSLETSVNPEITTVSEQTHAVVHNEAVGRLSFQAEIGQRNEVISLPEVNIKRPIHSTVDKILEALRDLPSQSICLYGRGGSGKTIVLKTLFQHPTTKYLFDQVIFVTVPRIAHLRKIQDEIMQQLSLSVPNSDTVDQIAARIHRALLGGKFLLLLDDVCGTINLVEVGIPNLGPESRCSLVLTTRSREVCRVIADREIEMEALSTVEAWEFFCSQAGRIIDSPEIKPYAQLIAEGCRDLPLIISIVGSALRGESSVIEWKLALRNFLFSDTSSLDDQYSTSPLIRYCYNRLKARDVKNCFLYCALFPRDREINVSILVECFVNERLLRGRTIDAYKRGHDILRLLVKASLLEASDNGLMVKMHNVIRDSALEILSSDVEGYQLLTGSYSRTSLVQRFGESSLATTLVDKYLTKAGAQLKETPSLEEWEQANIIFLMDNEFSSLPIKPNCPNLVALFLQRNNSLRVIPASFFYSMCTLKILNLSNTRIKTLPESFSKLENLEVLVLRDCERLLMLPPSIEFLKFLEVLDLQGTELSHLPDFVAKLTSLKQLRVSFYGSINHSEYNELPKELISDGIISSLELTELGIFVFPGERRWTSNASSITKEVSSLSLSGLYFHFPCVDDLKCFVHESPSWKNKNLTAFNFIVGRDSKRVVSQVSHDTELMHGEEERCLRFVNGENIPYSVVEVLTRATSFYLDHHLNISYLSDFGLDSIHALKICILRDCPELLQVINGNEHSRIFLPFLEYLSINFLWKLERIWIGHLEMGSLARLKYLSVRACPKLTYVLTCSMLDILHNLEELVIEDCASLEHIVIEDNMVVGGYTVLGSLKVLKLHYLPKLREIWKGPWPRVEFMSFYDCPKLKNLCMKADDDVSIKEVAGEKAWWDLLDWDDHVLSRRLHERVTEICTDDL